MDRRALAVLTGLLVALGAAAVPAAATGAGTQALYAYDEGCTPTGELVPTVDGYTRGCGYVGGLPGVEAGATAGRAELAGVDLDSTTRYVSEPARRPVLLDRSRPVTGRVAAESWYGLVADVGVGQVTWDLTLWGVPARGRAVELGRTTVSALVLPGQEQVSTAFRIALGSAARASFRQVRLDVRQRGLNVGMTARRLGGATRVLLPLRAR